MKITKYLHSCLLVEEEGKTILLDPGQYTYEENVLNLNAINNLDYILITHEHTDHFYLPFVKKLLEKFSQAKIYTTASLVSQLQQENISALSTGNPGISIDPVPHEEILFFPVPENVKFTIAKKLTHPGDSFHFTSETDIIAMPMTAPWGSMVEAMKKVIELKPKVVIPIHDYHLKEEAIQAFYPRVADLLKPHGIDFKQVETGEILLVE